MDYDFPLDPELGGPEIQSSASDWGDDGEVEEESQSEDDIEADDTREEEDYAEYEEGELNRLISSTGAVTHKSATTDQALGQWQAEIEREMEEDLSLDEAMGLGRTSRKRVKKRTVGEQSVSPEVRKMLGRANLLYVQHEYTEAIALLNDIIKREPSLRTPWYTLSTIWQELGEREKSLQATIVAAKLTPLKDAGYMWKDAGNASRDMGMIQQAIYCFSQALKIDKNDMEAHWDCACLFRELGNTKRAVSSFETMLKVSPHDPNILRQLIPLLMDLPSELTAITHLQNAFTHYRSTVPDPFDGAVDASTCLTHSDLATLVDLIIHQKAYLPAIRELKTNWRWLQGRLQDEKIWKVIEEYDDREFDLDRMERIPLSGDTEPEELLEVFQAVQQMPTVELPLAMRLRLGICRLGLGQETEAMRHLSIVRDSDPSFYPELHLEVGDVLFEHEKWDEAYEVFCDLTQREEFMTAECWRRLGLTQRNLGLFKEAADTLQAVISSLPDDLEIKLQLAGVYEELGEWAKALDLVNEVLEIRKQMQDSLGPVKEMDDQSVHHGIFGETQSTFKKRKTPIRLTMVERRALEERIQAEFELSMRRLDLLESGTDIESQKEWTELAGEIIGGLRENPRLFPSNTKIPFKWKPDRRYKRKKSLATVDEQANQLVDRIQAHFLQEDNEEDNVDAEDYRGVHFNRWIEIIMKYATLCTKFGDSTTALDTLDHLAFAIVFRKSDRYYTLIYLTRASVCMNSNNLEGVTESLRTLMLRFPFHPDLLRLWQALCSRGHRAILNFSDSAMQKSLERRDRLTDVLASGVGKDTTIPKEGLNMDDKYILKINRGRWVLKPIHPGTKVSMQEEDEEEYRDDQGQSVTSAVQPWRPKQSNPYLQMVLGNMSILSRSYQWAIAYYLKVYDAHSPHALVCLCLGIGYIFRAMTRSVDNRHYAIAQGLAFLSKYRKLRGQCSESEYNMGRGFHTLGLHHLAIRHYQRVIEMSETSVQNGVDYSEEARYNLHIIFATVGQPDLSREQLNALSLSQ